MYGHYLAAVIRRAFQPTARFTDVLQILAASAAPAIARFFGVAVPSPDETLAYIGAAAVAFVALRIFFVAPYQVWREQTGALAELKTELSKPERLELAKLAEIRGAARAELAHLLTRMMFTAARYNAKRDKKAIAEMADVGIGLCGRANTSIAFNDAFTKFSHACFNTLEAPSKPTDEDFVPGKMTDAMLAYLHGEITGEVLALRLPLGTEPETQP